MRDLLDFYKLESQKCPDFPQLSALKTAAFADLETLGFPTRHDEAWKYTKTDQFTKQHFNLAMHASEPLTADVPFDVFFCDMTRGLMDSAEALPRGVIIQTWQDALLRHAEKIAPYLGRILKHTHGFHAQNTAMLRDGLFIYIPEHIILEKPLFLSQLQKDNQEARYIRHLIVMEPGSQATIIEDYQGEEGISYFTNTMTEVYLKAHASLGHYKMQRESRRAYHVGEVAVQQEASSHFESHSLSLGGQWVRSDTSITFIEPKASCFMNGIYITQDQQHVDHHTRVLHDVPHCTSEQDYKGMLYGRSRAVFNGIVVVAKDAQQTEAHQQNKNLLLSPDAEIDTKPQLEIDADDVTCTHGATVGCLDEEALFYLEARGIPKPEAQDYLVQAFVAMNLKKINFNPLSLWMSQLIRQHLV